MNDLMKYDSSDVISHVDEKLEKGLLPKGEAAVEFKMTPDKMRIFLSLLISLGVTQTLYMNISVFLPTFV